MNSWGRSWGVSWGKSWGAQAEEPVTPQRQIFSSMGRKRREARLARLRKDDEILLATIKAFLETT